MVQLTTQLHKSLPVKHAEYYSHFFSNLAEHSKSAVAKNVCIGFLLKYVNYYIFKWCHTIYISPKFKVHRILQLFKSFYL